MLKRVYNHFMEDSLYRNSIYLMLANGVMASLGFVFWLVCAKLFPAQEVGVASTLISLINLMTAVSLLGMNVSIVRFLPNSARKDDTINTVFFVTIVSGMIASTLFLLLLPWLSPSLLFVKENLFLSLLFIGSMVVMALFACMDNVFIAYRSAGYILLKSLIFSVMKLVVPVLFLGYGALAIFGSYVVSAITALLVLFVILGFKFGFRFRFHYAPEIVSSMMTFSFGNYLSGIIGMLPLTILPVMVLNRLGAQSVAYYYVAATIATLLFVIPQATANALFAEGSYKESSVSAQIKKASIIVTLLLVPALLAILIFGQHLLSAFGKTYSIEGIALLKILAFSGFFVAFNSVCEAVLKVKNQLRSVVIINLVGTTVVLFASYLLLPFGLVGIGWGWLIGQVAVSIVCMIILWALPRSSSSLPV